MDWEVGVNRTLRLFWRLTAGILISLVVFVGATLVFVLFTPVISFSHAQTQKLLTWLMPARFALIAQDSEFRIERGKEGLLSKRFYFSAKEFCLSSKDINVCFEEGVTGLSLSWRNLRNFDWRPEIIEVEPIRILGLTGEVRISPTIPGDGPKSADDGILRFVYADVVPKWRYVGSRLEVERLEIKTNEGEEVDLAFLIETEPSGAASLILRKFSLRNQGVNVFGRLNVLPQEKGFKFDTKASVNLPERRAIQLTGAAFLRDFETGEFKIQSFWHGFPGLREARLKGGLREARLKSHVSIRVAEVDPWLRSLELNECEFGLNLKSKSGAIRCKPGTVRVWLADAGPFRNGERLVLAPDFEFIVSRYDLSENPSADWKLRLHLDHRNLVDAEVNADGKLARAAGGKPDLTFDANLNASIDRFRRVVQLLRSTRFAVPAPLNVFDGTMGMTAWITWSKRKVDLKFQAETNLKSRHQSAQVKLSGETRVDRLAKEDLPIVDVTVEVIDLAMAAPRLDVLSIPRLTPDPRFGSIPSEVKLANGEKEASKTALFRVRVLTTSPDSIRISTNLTASPIPIGLDLAYSDLAKEKSKTTGWIAVGTTPVDIFRRQATVEELRFDLLESGVQKILARIVTSVHGYDISILLAGNVESPDVLFLSEPPLPRDQILSVLLFGRPLEELGNVERSSVTDVEAAFANAALGVASLYYFAKTPIESISYDPNRKLLTAQVGIGGGTSVEFGRGGQGSVVGFEKRLSREFVFRSDVERLSASGEQTVSALIEWVKRF